MLDPPPQTEAGWLIAESLRQRNTLQTILAQQGVVMATVQDLRTATDQLLANDAALASEVSVLSGSVDTLVTEFQRIKGQLSPADQAVLDQAVQDVTDAAAQLANQTQALSTEQQAVDTANPTAPQPAPAPAPAPGA